jgi:1-acyl-sn-glycerol-3-phosphate acyltransferase
MLLQSWMESAHQKIQLTPRRVSPEDSVPRQSEDSQSPEPAQAILRAGRWIRESSQVTWEKATYWSGRSIVDLYARLRLKRDVVWHAPLPSGAKIIAANHPTTTDPFYILTLAPEQMSVLVTGGAFTVPGFGRYLRAAGHVPVFRGNGGGTFEEARALLQAGRTVAVFPEGALSPDIGSFHKPHTGVARLALTTGAPVIPVGIHLQSARVRPMEGTIGGEESLGKLYLAGPYAMTVGRAMAFEGDVRDWGHVRSVSEQVMQRIIQLSQQSARRLDAAGLPDPLAQPTPVGLTSVSHAGS